MDNNEFIKELWNDVQADIDIYGVIQEDFEALKAALDLKNGALISAMAQYIASIGGLRNRFEIAKKITSYKYKLLFNIDM